MTRSEYKAYRQTDAGKAAHNAWQKKYMRRQLLQQLGMTEEECVQAFPTGVVTCVKCGSRYDREASSHAGAVFLRGRRGARIVCPDCR